MSNGKPVPKCTDDAWCSHMQRAVEEHNAHKKGLIPINVANRNEADSGITIGVAFKRSAKDRGVMLNFCPWCGEKILADDLSAWIERQREARRLKAANGGAW